MLISLLVNITKMMSNNQNFKMGFWLHNFSLLLFIRGSLLLRALYKARRVLANTVNHLNMA